MPEWKLILDDSSDIPMPDIPNEKMAELEAAAKTITINLEDFKIK